MIKFQTAGPRPALSISRGGIPAPPHGVFSKAYAETIVCARLHQAHFRRETFSAYRRRCCICELDEGVLEGAAHVVPDRLPEGLATVRNHLCMCRRAAGRKVRHRWCSPISGLERQNN